MYNYVVKLTFLIQTERLSFGQTKTDEVNCCTKTHPKLIHVYES